MDGIRLLEHLGHGNNGSVFLVEYGDREVALKLQYGPKDEERRSYERGLLEYGVHCDLEGIPGIAVPMDFRGDISGDYDSLGLWKLGLGVQDVANLDRGEPLFTGAILFEHLDGLADISSGVFPFYFHRLRKILSRFTERGYAFPMDADFLIRNGSPAVLDLSAAPRLNDYGRYTSERMVDKSMERIELLESEFSLASAA